jgi:CHAD domain-containing protein
MSSEQEKPKTFGDWAVIAIAKHYQKTLKHEPEVLKDKDPEELHQMRVGMRRLRSAVSAFSLAINLPEAVGEKKVGQIAKVLGKLRDLDVLKETLETEYKPNLPEAEAKILDRALKQLKKERKTDLKKVHRVLETEDYQEFKQQLQDWLEKPNFQDLAGIAIETILPDLLLPQISQLMIHPGWLVGTTWEAGTIQAIAHPSSETIKELLEVKGESVHDLRKQAKRIRYNMSLFVQFYGDNYTYYLDRVKAIQEVLGQIQDCQVLSEFLQEALGKDLDRQLPTLNELFQQTQARKWLEWQTLQQQFFNPEHRQGFRDATQRIECRV